MNDDLFHHALNADKSKLKLSLHEATLELSAEQVAHLALFFANLRAEMCPEVSTTFPGPQASAKSDHFEVQQDHATGESEIRLRIPDLCWAFAYFSKEQCIRLSEVLNPQPSSIDASQLN